MSVRLKDVVKHFRSGGQVVRAVDGVDLELADGEFAALAGPSGSGKTTLLHLIGGLDRADSGSVILDGADLDALSERARAALRLKKIGFVFQAYNLLPVLTAYENIQLVLQAQGVPAGEHRDRIFPLLTALGIADLAHRRPSEMSGGQQQRVAVARSVAGRPTMVLADEPTANLDSTSAAELMGLMRRLNEERRVTFLFSSHDPVVIDAARRVIRLKDGRIQSEERR